MSRRIANLAFAAALGLTASVWFSGVAEAGPSSVCGNNTVEPPEECDDGNTVTGDGCSGVSCLPEVCGDGTLNEDPGVDEQCDDSNTVNNDGCDANCQLECGNGVQEPSEECDTSGQSATCDDDCTAPVCGDNNLNEDANEQCDDGNTVAGDGCSDTCQSETSPLDKAGQACVNGINANMLGVLKAQDKDIAGCLKAVAAGKDTVAACLATDSKGKVAKAQAKTTSTDTKKCTPAPGFAYTGATTVNPAAADAAADAAIAVFGNPPVVADSKVDKAGAGCQAEVAKRHNKLLETWAAEANKAKKTALKGSKTTPGVANGTALAAAIDQAAAASAKVTKAENGVNTGLAKKCTDAIVDGLFDCEGAATVNDLALCVIRSAKRGACLALEQSDAIALACPGDS